MNPYNPMRPFNPMSSPMSSPMRPPMSSPMRPPQMMPMRPPVTSPMTPLSSPMTPMSSPQMTSPMMPVRPPAATPMQPMMRPVTNPNVLYYSNSSIQCQTLVRLLENEKLLSYFQKVCVDNNPNYPQTGLPILIMGKMGKMFRGPETFQWVDKIKYYRMHVWMKKMNEQQKKQLENVFGNVSMNELGDILGFSKIEMDGLSDMFAYFESDDNVPHNYVDFNDIGKSDIVPIITPHGSDLMTKISKDKYNRALSDTKRQREEQDGIFKKKIDEFYEKVYN